MANKNQLEKIKSDISVWNRWRNEHDRINIDLSGADLTGVNLKQVNLSKANLKQAKLNNVILSGANLIGANLSEANLMNASLNNSNLSGVNLTHATLQDASFTITRLVGANLDRVNLNGAMLNSVNFSSALLKETNFTDCHVLNTNFNNVNLSDVVGLDSIIHRGPSSIDLRTLVLSKGKISPVFLRGCGASEVQIEMVKLHDPTLSQNRIIDITYRIVKLLNPDVIHFQSSFLSYSERDREFAEKLHDDLQDNGARCWFAPQDLKIGDKYRTEIDRSIYKSDKLIVILSKHSIESQWVASEVEIALEREIETGNEILFPIMLDESVMDEKIGWASNIRRTRHIGDFCCWQESKAYQIAFKRLLNDLKV